MERGSPLWPAEAWGQGEDRQEIQLTCVEIWLHLIEQGGAASIFGQRSERDRAGLLEITRAVSSADLTELRDRHEEAAGHSSSVCPGILGQLSNICFCWSHPLESEHLQSRDTLA